MFLQTALLATALTFSPLVLLAQTEASLHSLEPSEIAMTEQEVFAMSAAVTLLIMLGSGVLGRSARGKDRRF